MVKETWASRLPRHLPWFVSRLAFGLCLWTLHIWRLAGITTVPMPGSWPVKQLPDTLSRQKGERGKKQTWTNNPHGHFFHWWHKFFTLREHVNCLDNTCCLFRQTILHVSEKQWCVDRSVVPVLLCTSLTIPVYFSVPQSNTPVRLHVLFQYYYFSITPVRPCTTWLRRLAPHCTTPEPPLQFHNVLFQYHSVPQRATPVLLCTKHLNVDRFNHHPFNHCTILRLVHWWYMCRMSTNHVASNQVLLHERMNMRPWILWYAVTCLYNYEWITARRWSVKMTKHDHQSTHVRDAI